MNKMRVSVLGVLVFVLCLILPWECKAGEDFSNAQIISTNSTVMGNTEKGFNQEKDYYQFSAEQDGSLAIQFSNPYQRDAKHYWTVSLYNQNYEALVTEKIYGNQTLTILPEIGIGAGVYYVKVTSAYGYEAASTDVYSLNVGYTTSDCWEKELNDEFISATQIDLNKMYYGSTVAGNVYEKDYYKFTTAQNGRVIIQFGSKLQKDTKEYWRVYLYDEKYTKIAEVNVHGNTTETDSPEIGIPAGTYYIQVESSYGYDVASKDTYSLKADFTISDYWEKEVNDDFTSATPMILGKTYSGSTVKGNVYEKDYYCYDITDPGSYTFTMTTPILHSDDHFWDMTVYNSSYEEISNTHINGNQEMHKTVVYATKGVYYVCIKSSWGYDVSSTETYGISITKTKSTKIAKASIKSIKNISGKKIKLTINKVKGADGYIVLYSTSPKFEWSKVKSVDIKGTTVTLSSLKKGKTYYVKVKAYKYDGPGTWRDGAYSKVKKIKIKK